MNGFAFSPHAAVGTKVLQRQKVATKVNARFSSYSILMTGLLCLLIASILFYVWTRVQVVRFGYEISSALREREEAIIDHHELTVEGATLRSAQQVEKRARDELLMRMPRKDQLIILR